MRLSLAAAAGKAFDVVGFGVATFDHVCVVERPPAADGKQKIEAYVRQPGGQVPTALVALQRWGLRTAFVGTVGDDEGGTLQTASLREEGVDLSGCRRRSGVRSQTSIILVDRVTGARTVLWDRPPGLALRAGEMPRDVLSSGRALLMDADDVDTALIAARWAREEAALVMLDVDEPGPRGAELLAASDVVIVSGDFPQLVTGTASLRPALRQMLGMGPALAVATLGAGGALAYAAESSWYIPAFRVPVVDSTSAGDLFHAGALYGILQGWDVPRAMKFAAAAAALECTRLGGRAAIPSLDRIFALIGDG